MQLHAKEKFEFLKLAQYVAKIDGHYGEKEKSLIDEYCCEMGIDNLEFEDDSLALNSILKSFESRKSQKIILMALMLLIHVDDNFNFNEKSSIHIICQKFNIDKKEFITISNWGKAVSALREQAIHISLD